MPGKTALLGLIAVLNVAAGLFPAPSNSGGRIVSATFTDVRTLNPYLTTDSETAAYSRLINAGLVRLNPLTNKPEPWLAESWTSSSDELSWTFKLQEGITWSDGHPFTGQDVLFTMAIVNDSKIKSFAQDVLTIQNAPVQWRLLDPYRIQADLPFRHVTFLRHLDAAVCPILAKHFWEKLYRTGKFSDVLRPDSQFPTLGPFVLKDFAAGQKLVLSRNVRFWKKDSSRTPLPYLQEVIFLILANQDQVQLRIENGEIDTYQNIRPSDVERLRSKARNLDLNVINVGPALDMEGFFLNQNRGTDLKTGKPFVDPVKLSWFTDPNFRQAISMAIDRDALVRNSLFGHGIPAYGPESPGNRHWFSPELQKQPYNLKAAERLLDKSGFVRKKNPGGKIELYDRAANRVRFTLYTNAENSIRNTQCILIVSDLAKLGMEVHYKALDFATLIQSVDRSFQYDAVLLGLSRTDVDPGERRNMLMSNGSLHFWWPRQERPFTPWEKRIDDLMNLTMSTSDHSLRKKYYYEVQRILAEQQPMIFTIHPYAFICARTRIANLKPSLLKHRTLWNAEELYWEK